MLPEEIWSLLGWPIINKSELMRSSSALLLWGIVLCVVIETHSAFACIKNGQGTFLESGSPSLHSDSCRPSELRVSRPHSVSITEFGAVGDGKAVNTHAFENAIFYLRSFAEKGGAQLYIPPGKWVTGSFSLTSHLTLHLDYGAVIIGSQMTV